jgi:hypothetical protein
MKPSIDEKTFIMEATKDIYNDTGKLFPRAIR